jgi:hypothetical protein
MSDAIPDDLDSLEFAVFGTQGGGLARLEGRVLVWIELPDWCPTGDFDPKVGDPVPEEWGCIPANVAAHESMLLS